MTQETDLSTIGEVKTEITEAGSEDEDDGINEYLKEGWILLDVRAVQYREGGYSRGFVTWVLGKSKEQRNP